MSFKLASLILYSSFILLTAYQAYYDNKNHDGGECTFELGMLLFEIIAVVSEFISLKITVFVYICLLATTIIDMFLHKEDD